MNLLCQKTAVELTRNHFYRLFGICKNLFLCLRHRHIRNRYRHGSTRRIFVAKSADSGYLTRRLVDVSQELIIREIDCCADRDFIPGMEITGFMDGKEMIESLEERITGT